MGGNLIETINRLVRVSRKMLLETGREPNAEELARRLAMPLDRVKKLIGIVRLPIKCEASGCD